MHPAYQLLQSLVMMKSFSLSTKSVLEEIENKDNKIRKDDSSQCVEFGEYDTEKNILISTEYLEIGHSKSRPLLKPLSIHFKKGKSYGIVGSSGSGKTSLIDTLLLLQTPISGKLKIMMSKKLKHGGQIEIEENKARWMSSISIVEQETFFPDSNVVKNITGKHAMVELSEKEERRMKNACRIVY